MCFKSCFSIQSSSYIMSRSHPRGQKLEIIFVIFLFLISSRVYGGPPVFNECGGELSLKPDETYGLLTTPNFPSKDNPKARYENNLDCTWKTLGDDSTLAVMKIWVLSVQPGKGNSNETCDYDYVTVSIGSIETQKFCGFHSPDVIRGLGVLEVHFHSDDRYTYAGVQITFQLTPDFDPCMPDPCNNAGTCELNKKTLRPDCTCFPGTTGEFCRTDIKECESDPCMNGGTCDDSGPRNTYQCRCPSGWTGENCEKEKLSPCLSNPCQHGGICSVLNPETAECDCQEGYIGDMCGEKTGCGNPGIPYLKEHRRFKFGTRLKLSCIENYIMEGAETLVCLQSGKWSKKFPDCILNGTKGDEAGLSSWSRGMIVLGTLFTINLFVFVTWMVYRSPWAVYNRISTFVNTKILKKDLEYPNRTSSISTISVQTFTDYED